jgi:Predicted metal-binding, possibly nucleic acid-binding protein
MLISLSEIMTTNDKVVQVSVPIELERFDYQGDSYEFARKEPVNLTISNLGNKTVMIEGSTNISLTLFCDRCLKEIIYPMSIELQKEVDFNLTEEERADGLDETNYIIGYNLDVDTLIYDEILIGFPMKLLCSEDCKGLCKNCGTNLNEKSCDCDTFSYDPRMSVIRDIFKNFKEV